mmetsp:Transcript_167014/g.531229  ORF Transcript_167014/g.531229 Transcript_167014/m.531229 type:complete len:124 (+) Transcript_167014:126-497(+)
MFSQGAHQCNISYLPVPAVGLFGWMTMVTLSRTSPRRFMCALGERYTLTVAIARAFRSSSSRLLCRLVIRSVLLRLRRYRCLWLCCWIQDEVVGGWSAAHDPTCRLRLIEVALVGWSAGQGKD